MRTALIKPQSSLVPLVIVLMLQLFGGLFLYELTARSAVAQEDSVHVLDQLKERVQVHTLSNGLRVIFYRRTIDSQTPVPVFSSVLAVRVGGVDEVVGHTGISHLLEHMAFKGTPEVGTTDYQVERPLLEELEDLIKRANPDGSLPSQVQERWDEIHQELKKVWVTDGFTREYDKRGAVGMNASTGTELTRYYVSLPRSAFTFWCQMESDRILNPVMRQFYQELSVVGEERRMRFDDDPNGKLYETLLSSAFRAHPYRNPVIGYSFDLRRLTATEVSDFHRSYYIPSNMVIGLVGDVDAERDLPEVERYFGRIPPGTVPARTMAVEPPQEGERRFTVESTAAPLLSVAYHKPAFPHPDDVPLSMMSEILAGGKVSPLYTELVKKRQLAVSVGYYEVPGQASPNLVVFNFVPRAPHTSDDVLNAFDDIVRHFIVRPIDSDLLKIAKRSLAVDYISELRSSLGLAQLLASTELLFDDWEEVIRWYELAMEVTEKEVSRVAAQYLVSKNRTIGEIKSVKE